MTNRLYCTNHLFCEEYASIDHIAVDIVKCTEVNYDKAVIVEYGILLAPLFPNRRANYIEHQEYNRARAYLKEEILKYLPDNTESFTLIDNANPTGNWCWIFNGDQLKNGYIRY